MVSQQLNWDSLKGVDSAIVTEVLSACEQAGAKSLVLNTGPVQNIDLAIKLGQAAQKGRTIVGGVVRLISEPGAKAPIFEITWKALPKITP